MTTLQTYLNNTAETRREYEEYVKKEQSHIEESKGLKEKVCWLRVSVYLTTIHIIHIWYLLSYYQEFIRLAKEQLVEEKEEYEGRIKCMREARQRLYGYIRRGNELIAEGMKLEHKQLSIVVQESNAVIKVL